MKMILVTDPTRESFAQFHDLKNGRWARVQFAIYCEKNHHKIIEGRSS
jgi:hypothetical protein